MGKATNSVLEKARRRNAEAGEENGGSSPTIDTGGNSTKSTSTGTTASGGTTETGRRKPTDGIEIDGRTEGKENLQVEEVPRIEKPDSKSTRKPRTNTSKKTADKEATKKQELNQSAQMISSLLKTLTDISAMRTGQHWQLSKEETDNIAKPLVGILDRYNLLEKIANGSDIIALGTAIGAAFAPRIFYQLQINKQRKVKVNADTVRKLQTNQQPRINPESLPGVHNADATTGTGSNQSNGGQDTSNDQTSTAEFLTQFPATVDDSYQ